MKACTKSDREVFTPVTLEITIESEDELLSLFHRVNCSPKSVERSMTNSFKNPKEIIRLGELYDALWKIVKDRGYKK